MHRKASVEWLGDFKKGKGVVSTASGALQNVPYSFSTRFEDNVGTNPEELVAAAQASCFTMALANELGKEGAPPASIHTSADVHLEKKDDVWSVNEVHIKVHADVPGIDQEQFQRIAEYTKKTCPISRLLKADISLEAMLDK